MVIKPSVLQKIYFYIPHVQAVILSDFAERKETKISVGTFSYYKLESKRLRRECAPYFPEDIFQLIIYNLFPDDPSESTE